MKSAVKVSPILFAVALLAFAMTSCRKPPVSMTAWAVELLAKTNAAQAMFRLSATNLLPGARLDCELIVTTPAATHVPPPQLQPPDLEPVDFTVLPVSLDASGNELRQFSWTFQAGPPSTVTNQSVRLIFVSAQLTNSLKIKLPAIVIQSVFAPGTFTNALPPLEETNAF